MYLCSIHVKNKGPFLLSNQIPKKPFSSRNISSMIGASSGNLMSLEIRVSNGMKLYGKRSFVVTAIGKKKNNGSNNNNNNSSDNSTSSSGKGDGNQSKGEGDGQKESNMSESNKSKGIGSQKFRPKPLDWREFRAGLYIQEKAEFAVADSHNQDSRSKSLPQKWAHPISVPENGCLLVATEKLDGCDAFERTVILLLRAGTRHPQEGPFGIIINRPGRERIKHARPNNVHLQTVFAECLLHFGGPLEAHMFLLRSGEISEVRGFEEVIPGVCFGSRNSLDGAAAMVKKGVLKLQDFRFFEGYAGWQFDQLRDEIDSGFWCVAAASTNLIFGASQNSSSEGLWEEILQLMGGQYSELSRKPKKDTLD